ncbi:MAG: hypothetical protein OXF02_06260 [Simkaniaceae bacterium]|nr:hypothetical protein [Simkaniaceae bacterium]
MVTDSVISLDWRFVLCPYLQGDRCARVNDLSRHRNECVRQVRSLKEQVRDLSPDEDLGQQLNDSVAQLAALRKQIAGLWKRRGDLREQVQEEGFPTRPEEIDNFTKLEENLRGQTENLVRQKGDLRREFVDVEKRRDDFVKQKDDFEWQIRRWEEQTGEFDREIGRYVGEAVRDCMGPEPGDVAEEMVAHMEEVRDLEKRARDCMERVEEYQRQEAVHVRRLRGLEEQRGEGGDLDDLARQIRDVAEQRRDLERLVRACMTRVVDLESRRNDCMKRVRDFEELLGDRMKQMKDCGASIRGLAEQIRVMDDMKRIRDLEKQRGDCMEQVRDLGEQVRGRVEQVGDLETQRSARRCEDLEGKISNCWEPVRVFMRQRSALLDQVGDLDKQIEERAERMERWVERTGSEASGGADVETTGECMTRSFVKASEGTGASCTSHPLSERSLSRVPEDDYHRTRMFR